MSHPQPPDLSTRIGTAPARLCLGGEDLDWIGGPALLTAIELRVAVTYEPLLRPTLRIDARGALASRLTLTDRNWSHPADSDLELIRLCWHHSTAERHRHGGTITVRSDVPPKAGLASSATACVAAIRALVENHPDNWWSHYLVQTAYDIEHHRAGRPVGPMDFVPAAFGGTTLVQTDNEQIIDLTHHTLPATTRFLVVDTQTPRDTGKVIAWKRARLEQGERGIRTYARRMPDLVAEQSRLLASGAGLDILGETLDEAQTLLQHQLAVSTDLIDTCVNRLRARGALGVKLTGTGLGGCLFALTTVEEAATGRLASGLLDLPVTTRLVEPAAIGATSGKPGPMRTRASARPRRRPPSRATPS